MMESFFQISNYFMWEKKHLKYSIFDPEYSHISSNKSIKSLSVIRISLLI